MFRTICAGCNDEFEHRDRIQKFCSVSCVRTKAKCRAIKACPVCSKQFTNAHLEQVYCSVQCRRVGALPKQKRHAQNQHTKQATTSAWVTDEFGNLTRVTSGGNNAAL